MEKSKKGFFRHGKIYEKNVKSDRNMIFLRVPVDFFVKLRYNEVSTSGVDRRKRRKTAMKNIFKSVLALSLALVMLLALVSCDKSGSIKKAFEKEEYTVTSLKSSDLTENDLVVTVLDAAGLTEEQIEKLGKYELIWATKGLSNGLIVKFPGSGDVKSFLTVKKDDKDDTSMYDKAKEDGRINGNCLFIGTSNAKDIFKKA